MFNRSNELVCSEPEEKSQERDLLAATEIFKALGDVTRLRILEALASREMSVHEIAEALGMTQSAISHQLGTLRTLRIVKARREGRLTFYSIDDSHVKQLYDQCIEHVSHG
ncbi:MAG TPA: metalloregulator ArsR/SmtB family transcription factor [Methanocella sp.]|nr:metalloregulator ArsR/SmtB family transcription factor [Methanocella sp.]